MLKVCSNHSIVQYVDYMRGAIKEGGPERSLRSHPTRSITGQTVIFVSFRLSSSLSCLPAFAISHCGCNLVGKSACCGFFIFYVFRGKASSREKKCDLQCDLGDTNLIILGRVKLQNINSANASYVFFPHEFISSCQYLLKK